MGSRSKYPRSSSLAVSMLMILVTICTLPPTNAKNFHLNHHDYYDVTHNKTVFIKFYAPWCSFSKKMARDWDKLTDEWQGHEVGLVAEVDCTDTQKGGGKKLCDHLGIESFPTLKYGDPSNLWEYNGGRSFEEMNDFAKKNLIPLCSIENFEICDPETKLLLKRLAEMDKSELKELIKEEEKKLEDAEKEYKNKVDELTIQYEIAEKIRRNAINKVLNGHLGTMRQVMMARDDAPGEEEEKNTKSSSYSRKEEL
ncbi:thioredoxin [Nitzschia inconspicua]|uniref:Thioredoxin n=1 Tax=Nitzschia inconspicua TaxID=303405 RepID=A0A9K3Q259_9STRA|nr:thioredoxin [Nitzschia inconspicua]